MGTPVRTTVTSATTPATAKKAVPLEDSGKMPQCCLGGKRMDESGRYLLEEGRRDVPIVFANCISGKTYREARSAAQRGKYRQISQKLLSSMKAAGCVRSECPRVCDACRKTAGALIRATAH